MKNARFLTLVFTLLIPCLAWVQPVPTYAWRRTFDNLNRDDKATNLVTDVSGNVYMQYSSSGTGATCHLAKVSPANNLIFDKSGTEFGGFRATGCCISPPVSGKQYIWVTGVVTNVTPNPAYCNNRTNPRIASGRIVNDPYSGQWGSYDPSGSFQFGDTSFGSHSSAQDTYTSYKANPLPENWIGVIRNNLVIDNSNSAYTL